MGAPSKDTCLGSPGRQEKRDERHGRFRGDQEQTCDRHQELAASPALFTLPPTLPVKTGSRSQVLIEFYGIVYGILSLSESSASVRGLCLCAHSAVLSAFVLSPLVPDLLGVGCPPIPGRWPCQRPSGPLPPPSTLINHVRATRVLGQGVPVSARLVAPSLVRCSPTTPPSRAQRQMMPA